MQMPSVPKFEEVAFMALVVSTIQWLLSIAPAAWELQVLGAALAIAYWVESQYGITPPASTPTAIVPPASG